MLTIRPADSETLLEQAFSLRHEVFVREQQVPAQHEIDEFEQHSRHLLVFDDGVAVGTARWRQTATGIKLERFAIRAGRRGQGIGSLLLEAILADIRQHADPGLPLYLHAQSRAERFYARAGFRTEGEAFEECGIRHVRMRLTR